MEREKRRVTESESENESESERERGRVREKEGEEYLRGRRVLFWARCSHSLTSERVILRLIPPSREAAPAVVMRCLKSISLKRAKMDRKKERAREGGMDARVKRTRRSARRPSSSPM